MANDSIVIAKSAEEESEKEKDEEVGRSNRRAVAGDGKRYVSRGPGPRRVVWMSQEDSVGLIWRSHSRSIMVRC